MSCVIRKSGPGKQSSFTRHCSVKSGCLSVGMGQIDEKEMSSTMVCLFIFPGGCFGWGECAAAVELVDGYHIPMVT